METFETGAERRQTELLRVQASELERMNKALRETAVRLSRAEAQARVILETSIDTMLTFDRNGIILSANPALMRMFGYAEEDVVGRPLTLLVPSLKGLDFAQVANRPYETRTSGQLMEAMPVRADGTTFHAKLQIGMGEVRDERLFACTISDCTEQKLFEAELLEAKAAAETGARVKNDFLAMVSHEIRTPMNGVIGMTELLLETELTDKQRAYAENIGRSGEALLAVIKGILDYATFESGEPEVEEIPFLLEPLIRETFDVFASAAKRSGLEFDCRIDPRLDMPIVSDPALLRQVLLHLIGNSVKFTNEGGICVEAELRFDHGDELDIAFKVQDTGVGIPADKTETLFQPFRQLDSSLTRIYGGTGLGLAISKRLVHLLGGTIEIESGREKGASVGFTVRARRSMTERGPSRGAGQEAD